jgi:hypothetical protein
VDLHLEHIPSLGTLTVRCLTSRNLQVLGWQTDWALDAQILALGSVDELGGDLLEGLDIARGKSDANLVDFLG